MTHPISLHRLFYLFCLSTMLFTNFANASATVTLDKHISYPESSWNPAYKNYLTQPTYWLKENWRSSITLAPPPDLITTANEINTLLTLRNQRPEHQSDIDKEVELKGIYEKFYLALRTSEEESPELKRLLNIVFEDATAVAFHFKDHFKRARPYHYYPEIEPTIKAPQHPAYPSGHATQANTIALALSEAFPAKKAMLKQVAQKIAFNREIGGVHYASDSTAGIIIAKQIIQQMKNNRYFNYTIGLVREEASNNARAGLTN